MKERRKKEEILTVSTHIAVITGTLGVFQSQER